MHCRATALHTCVCAKSISSATWQAIEHWDLRWPSSSSACKRARQGAVCHLQLIASSSLECMTCRIQLPAWGIKLDSSRSLTNVANVMMKKVNTMGTYNPKWLLVPSRWLDRD